MASVVDYLFEDFKDCLIRHLSLTIILGVILRGETMGNMEAVTKFMNILIFEGTPVISDNGNNNTVSTNDIVEDCKEENHDRTLSVPPTTPRREKGGH